MKMPKFRNIFAGTAVALATALGTVDKAQAQTQQTVGSANISFHINGTCTVNDPEDGINYTANTTTVVQHYTIDTAKANQGGFTAGIGYEVITMPSGIYTNSPVPVGFGIDNFPDQKGNFAGFILYSASYTMGFVMHALTPDFTLDTTTNSIQKFFDSYNQDGSATPGADGAFTSPNSPTFHMDRVNTFTSQQPITLSITPSANNNINLSWNSEAGKSYQVQSCTNLGAGNWNNWGSTILASTNMASVRAPATNSQEFFRVALQ